MPENHHTQASPRIAVLGGGISGLAAAFWLTEYMPQAEITIFESQPRWGGLIGTRKESGAWLESGPLAFPAWAPATGELLTRAGLGSVCKVSGSSRGLGLWDGRRLIKFPKSPWAFLRSRLVSPLGLLRLLLEPLMPCGPRYEDETISQFFRRRTGKEFLECFLEPVTSGILSGDPDTMSMVANLPQYAAMEKDSGSLALGFAKKIFATWRPGQGNGYDTQKPVSTETGAQGVIDALVQELERRRVRLRPSHRISTLTRAGSFRLGGDAKCVEEFDGVVSCLPSHVLAPLAVSWPKEHWKFLAGIPHAPLVVSHLEYSKAEISQEFSGEGVLLRSRVGEGILSVYLPSRMPNRKSHADREMFRVLAGGAKRPEMVFLGGEAINILAVQTIQKILQPSGAPRIYPIIRHERGLPQLVLGHSQSLAAVKRWLNSEWPGFYLSGTSFSGAGIESGVASGKRAAQDAAVHFRQARV